MTMELNRMQFKATFDKEIIEQPSAGEYRFYDKHNNEKVFDFRPRPTTHHPTQPTPNRVN